jgi:hypothetical protein
LTSRVPQHEGRAAQLGSSDDSQLEQPARAWAKLTAVIFAPPCLKLASPQYAASAEGAVANTPASASRQQSHALFMSAASVEEGSWKLGWDWERTRSGTMAVHFRTIQKIDHKLAAG